MNIFHAVVLGIVEGITEFIPVSSTGHMILASHIMGIPDSEFLKTFEVFIQLGALLALVSVFAKKLWKEPMRIKGIIVGFIPTAIAGLFLYKIVKHLLGDPMVVAWSLLLGGVALIVVEWFVKNKKHTTLGASAKELSLKDSFIVGCYQILAFIPGVSRSGATIVGGLLQGLSRSSIVEFSFLLSIPTIAAASGLDLLKTTAVFHTSNIILLVVGFVTAFISALFCVKFFMKYISTHSFTVFGVYRIIIALIFMMMYL